MSTQNNYSKYAERIKLFRNTRGYSLDRFAKLIGQSPETITTWEEGTAIPDLETMTKMQEAFDINLTWLATGKEEMLCKKPPTVIGPQIDALLDIAGLEGDSKCKEYIYAFCTYKRIREPALETYKEQKASSGFQKARRRRHLHEGGE